MAHVVAELIFFLVAHHGKRRDGRDELVVAEGLEARNGAEVELNGKASAKPRSELRVSVRCRPLASKVNDPSQVGLNVYWLLITRFIVVGTDVAPVDGSVACCTRSLVVV